MEKFINESRVQNISIAVYEDDVKQLPKIIEEKSKDFIRLEKVTDQITIRIEILPMPHKN